MVNDKYNLIDFIICAAATLAYAAGGVGGGVVDVWIGEICDNTTSTF